jgi:hypothetical protein
MKRRDEILKRMPRLVGENIGKCVDDVTEAFGRQVCETAEAAECTVNKYLQRRLRKLTKWALKKLTDASKEGEKTAALMEEDWNTLIRLMRVDDSLISRFRSVQDEHDIVSSLERAGEAVRFDAHRSMWSKILGLASDWALPVFKIAIASILVSTTGAASIPKAWYLVASAVQSVKAKLRERRDREGMQRKILNHFRMRNAAIAKDFTRCLRDIATKSFEVFITAFRNNSTLTVATIRQALAECAHEDVTKAIRKQEKICDELRFIVRDLDLMSDLDVEPTHRHLLIARLEKINDHIASHYADDVAGRITLTDKRDELSRVDEKYREEADAQRILHEQQAARILNLFEADFSGVEEKKGDNEPSAAEEDDLSDIDDEEDLFEDITAPHDHDDAEAHYNTKHVPLLPSPEHFVDACTLCNHIYEDDQGKDDEQDGGVYLGTQRIFAHVKAQGRGLVRWTLYRARSTMYLCFRGTKQPTDMLVDILALPVDVHEVPGLQAHRGIAAALQCAMRIIRKTLVANLRDVNIDALIITGHSLGGAYAVLALINLMRRSLPATLCLGCITFGAPLVPGARTHAVSSRSRRQGRTSPFTISSLAEILCLTYSELLSHACVHMCGVWQKR